MRRAALLHQDRRQPGVGRARPRAAGRGRPATAAGRGRRRWPPGRRRRPRAPASAPARRAPAARRWAARPGPGRRRRRRPRRTRIGGSGSQASHDRGQQRRAGRRAHLRGHRPAADRHAAQQLQHGGGGHRDDAVRPARRPAAERDRRGGQPLQPEVLAARRPPRRRRPARPARPPRGSAPSSAATRCTRPSATASRSKTASAPSRTRGGQRRPRRAAPRTSGQVRGCVLSGACTCTRVAPSPCRVTGSARQRDRLDGQRGDRRRGHLQRHAGVDQRAEQHVAAGARREVQPAGRHPLIMAGDAGRVPAPARGVGSQPAARRTSSALARSPRAVEPGNHTLDVGRRPVLRELRLGLDAGHRAAPRPTIARSWPSTNGRGASSTDQGRRSRPRLRRS